eukprot:jgi/Mesvir1/26691/Mv20470-RA.2
MPTSNMAVGAKVEHIAAHRSSNIGVHLPSRALRSKANLRRPHLSESKRDDHEYKPTPVRIRSPWFIFVAGNLLLSIAAFLGIVAVQAIVHLQVDCCTLFVDVFVALGVVAVCASVPVTHFIGGYWRYAAQGWASWQPFVGGFRFVLFQALSWCLYSMALVLVTMPLLPANLLPHSLLPPWMLPTLVTGGGASALLAEMLMVSSLLTFQGGPAATSLKADASQPLDADGDGSRTGEVTSAMMLASSIEKDPSPLPSLPSPKPPHASSPLRMPCSPAQPSELVTEEPAADSAGTEDATAGPLGDLPTLVREAGVTAKRCPSTASTEVATEPCSPLTPGSDPLGVSDGSTRSIGDSSSRSASTVASTPPTSARTAANTLRLAGGGATPHLASRLRSPMPGRPPRPLLRTLWMRFLAGLVITVLYTPHYLFLLALALPFGALPFQWAVFVHTVLLTPYVALTYRGKPQLNGRRRWEWIRVRVVAVMEEAADLYFGGMAIIVDGDEAETTQEGEACLPGGGKGEKEKEGDKGEKEGEEKGENEADGERHAVEKPHGLYPVTLGWFHMTTAWRRRLPGISPVALAASVIFYVPFLRDLFMWSGARDVSRHAFRAALKERNAVVLCPGGQKELIEFSRNGPNAAKISVYARHTGFVREALLANAALVPIFCFGETRLLHNLIHWPAAQSWTYKLLGFPMPFIPAGMAGFLPLPRRRVPVHVVVGKPIDPPPFTLVDGHVPPEVVKCVHRRYYAALASLFERYKAQCDHAGVELEVVGLQAEA